jgi:hypothetical protein
VANHSDALNDMANSALAEFNEIVEKMSALSYGKRLVDDEP